MYAIAWTITLDTQNPLPDSFDFDTIVHNNLEDKQTIFFFGETPCESIDDFLKVHSEELWNIKSFDISHGNEDSIFLDPSSYEEGVYEVTSFEGSHINFDDIHNRFEEVAEAICVRECEVSNRFWNKIIRVDFIY